MTQESWRRRPMTSLIGRKSDLAALSSLITDPRIQLVTICGVGGIGKSRLALEAIELVQDDFADGVIFLDLVSTKDPALLPEQLMNALVESLPLPASDSMEALALETLQPQQLLIVLDNFEHLLGAAGSIERLLAACPDVVVLATSRERLGLLAEHLFELKPLTTPDQHRIQSVEAIESSESVQLFLDRARDVERSFTLTESNAGDIAAICRRLDGLPLAIELAASRVTDLPPRLILRNFSHILPFLERTAADPEGRHRTMRNAIEWSYQLLPEREQELFTSLSVFISGCTIDGARAIWVDQTGAGEDQRATADIDLTKMLASLTSKHFFVRRDWNESEPRYDMLETIREFGNEKLTASGELETVRLRHAEYLIELARNLRAHMQGSEPGFGLDRYNQEIGEFRAAITWLLEGDEQRARMALILSNLLDFYWDWRGHAKEGEQYISAALSSIPDQNDLDCATGYLNLGNLEATDLERSRLSYEKSLRILRAIDHKRGIAGLLTNLGINAEARGDLETAMVMLEDALARFTDLENEPGVALCTYRAGTIALQRGQYAVASQHLDNAREAFERLGDLPNTLWTILEIGRMFRLEGKLHEAADVISWCLTRFEAAAIGQGIRNCLSELGWIELSLGNLTAAHARFSDSMRRSIDAAQIDGFHGLALDGMAVIAAKSAHPDIAVTIIASVDRWRAQTQSSRFGHYDEIIAEELERAKRVIGEDAFQSAWNRGTLLSIEEASRLEAEITLSRPVAPAPALSVATSLVTSLTDRERDVVCCVADGLRNKDIAEKLFISERTVAVHVQNILGKLQAGNRTHASSIVLQAGICAA